MITSFKLYTLCHQIVHIVSSNCYSWLVLEINYWLKPDAYFTYILCDVHTLRCTGRVNSVICEMWHVLAGRPPGPEMENCCDRESYSLAAGLALGLVMLGVSAPTTLQPSLEFISGFESILVELNQDYLFTCIYPWIQAINIFSHLVCSCLCYSYQC